MSKLVLVYPKDPALCLGAAMIQLSFGSIKKGLIRNSVVTDRLGLLKFKVEDHFFEE